MMSDRPSVHYQDSRGFTLLEILIAIFILGIVLSTIYVAYSGTLTVVRELDDDSRAYAMARITLDKMSGDLSSLQRFGDAFVLQSEKRRIGNREFGSISFWSAAHLAFEEELLSGYPASIAYFVREDKDGGLSLRRSDVAGAEPAKDKQTGGGIIICENVQALNLIFYDEGGQYYDSWDTASSSASQKGKPPVLVQIELILKNARDAEKPYKFITRVFLPVRK
jgi:prepilin-type N-terminal cleavage/methylation domain-containing protein